MGLAIACRGIRGRGLQTLTLAHALGDQRMPRGLRLTVALALLWTLSPAALLPRIPWMGSLDKRLFGRFVLPWLIRRLPRAVRASALRRASASRWASPQSVLLRQRRSPGARPRSRGFRAATRAADALARRLRRGATPAGRHSRSGAA